MIYILIGVGGPSWADAAINSFLLACAIVHIFGYVNGIVRNNPIVLLASIVLTVAYFLAFAMVQIGCFRGDSRFEGCGIYFFIVLVFVNAFVLFACNFDLVRQMALAFVVTLPLLVIGSHLYLSVPLYWTLLVHDLTSNCFLQSPSSSSGLPLSDKLRHAQRIKHIWDVKTWPIVGEHSPRIYRVSANKAHIWKYTRRQFSQYGGPATPPACAKGTK